MIDPKSNPLEQAQLFNLSELPRPDGSSLFIEFYAGDILSRHSDALIVSAFHHDYAPVPGSILGALYDRFGIDFSRGLPPGTRTHSGSLHSIPVPPCPVFQHLWILELSDWTERGNVTPGQIGNAFSRLRRHLPDILTPGVRSVALPLLGTGQMGLDIREITTRTLELAKSWASTPAPLEVLRVFAYEMGKVAVVSRTVDQLFSFASSETSSKLLAAAAEELHEKLNHFDPPLAQPLGELHQLTSLRTPSYKSLAVKGRVVAEVSSRALLEYFHPGHEVPGKGDLNACIYGIQQALLETQPWVLSYLRLLQACGNKAAHSDCPPMNSTDAAAIVVSAIRVAEFVKERASGS